MFQKMQDCVFIHVIIQPVEYGSPCSFTAAGTTVQDALDRIYTKLEEMSKTGRKLHFFQYFATNEYNGTARKYADKELEQIGLKYLRECLLEKNKDKSTQEDLGSDEEGSDKPSHKLKKTFHFKVPQGTDLNGFYSIAEPWD